jgi:hypothetical protein
MRTAVIYHSETGNTREVAEYLARQVGADLYPVRSTFPYNPLTRMVVGVRRSLCGTNDPVEPQHIDLGPYDCVAIGSPVWAGMPTPVINGAVAGFKNGQGKEAVIFMSCAGAPHGAARVLAGRVAGKGMKVKGSVVFSGREVSDFRARERLVTVVSTPGYGEIRID